MVVLGTAAGMGRSAEISQGVTGLLFQLAELVYMSALAFGSRWVPPSA